MGKKKKQNLVKVVAPQHVTKTDPVVISFAHWDGDELPKEVTVEVIEIDRKDSNDDNFTTADDIVARFAGTLRAAAGETAELTNIVPLAITSSARSPDNVWLRFANQKDVVEAGIPFSPAIAENKATKRKAQPAEFSANEGAFYELAAQVRDGVGEGGTILVTSAATAVRQRAFVLLAVEPLAQVDSTMSHPAGQRILETYHPSDKKAHASRKWGATVLRIRNHLPMLLSNSGCSYVIMTMVLRYLRIDAPATIPEEGAEALSAEDPTAGTTVRLFDHHIKLAELEKKPEHKPRFSKGKEFNPEVDKAVRIPAARLAKEREDFVAHFLAAADKEGKSADKKALGGTFDKKTRGKGTFVVSSVGAIPDESNFFHPSTHALGEHAYPSLLAWKLNILDDRAETFAMRRRNLQQHEIRLEGASDYRTLGHGEQDKWEPSFGLVPLMDEDKQLDILDLEEEGKRGISASNDQGILVPLAPAFAKAFGLIQTAPHTDVTGYDDDEEGDPDLLPWQRFFVRTLDRGLPIVALFSPGQYSRRDRTGHFCLVVGYRFLTDPDDPSKKRVRFVINDPAGARSHQYEAHDEEELNPEGVEPTAVLKPKAKTLGMKRERRGLNLIIERRMLLSLSEIRVFEPGSGGSSTWDPARHARFLFYRGKVKDVAE